MDYSLLFHELAHEEYIDAYEWYELSLSGMGEKFMTKVEKRLQQIRTNPEYYSTHYGRFRQVKVENFPYIIIYEFFKRKKVIHIASIKHSRRSSKGKYRRLK